ncbi:MAG TPA: hypothetical protein ENI88_08175 [Desulfobulbus sp.]|nr:hypothetical protein [Desulfobulbus sp.]
MKMGIFARINVDQLIAFLFQRYTEEGGFATAPSLPATIEDTFYVTDILSILEQLDKGLDLRSRIDAERLAGFIRRKYDEEKSRLPLRLIYYIYRIGKNIADGPVFSTEKFACTKLTYENYFYLQELERVTAEAKENLPPLNLARCTCKDVFFSLLLVPQPDALPPVETIATWLRACQNGDGGFGFFPGTTSFLENSYYCLLALSLIEASPADPARAEQFVVSCQTGAGGFARSIVGAPFPESSWHAVNIAQRLEQTLGVCRT